MSEREERLAEEELEQQSGEVLPDREVMSTVGDGVMEPLVIEPLPGEEATAPPPDDTKYDY